jgi:acetyl esterase/lipase
MFGHEGSGGAKDACRYMSEEEQAAFFRTLNAGVFDGSAITNKALDIPYGPLRGQLLDVYLPGSGEGPRPLIFYLHGGGWTAGSRKSGFLSSVIGALNRGYAVASVDYRLAPEVRFPEFLFDVKTAVRWARAHAKEFGFDPEHFVVAGDSAGGYLALMAGFTAGRPEYAGGKYGWTEYSDAVAAVCDIYAPTILTESFEDHYAKTGVKMVRRDLSEPDLHEMVFGTKSPGLQELISPLSHVHKDIPRTLILHGLNDGLVSSQHSSLLYERIREVCGEGRAELILYEGRNHGDPGFMTAESCNTIVDFFDSRLK